MTENDPLAEIFGQPGPGAPDTDDDAGDGEPQVAGIVLNITDEDLAEAEERMKGGEFKNIPQWTWCDFEITDLEAGFSQGGKTAGAPKWALQCRELSGQWGHGKRVRTNIIFSSDPQLKFMWLPFVKSVGLAGASGEFTLPSKEDVVGLKFRAQVMGHSWKNDLGDYKRSSGKKSERETPPTDGRPMYEDIGNYKPYESDDEPEGSQEGLKEFEPGKLFE